MKIKFNMKLAAQYVLKQTGRLAKVEEIKEIWIRRYINYERNKLRELREKIKALRERRIKQRGLFGNSWT